MSITNYKGELLFSHTPNEVINMAQVMLAHAETYLDELQAVNPSINAAFVATMKADVEAASHLREPYWLRVNVKVVREELKKLAYDMGQDYQTLLFYVGMAYTDRQTGWQVYGRKDYGGVRQSEAKMIPFMENVSAQIVKDAALLMAKGFTQDKIDAFGARLAALKGSSATIQDMESRNEIKKADFVAAMNSIWQRLADISATAKIAFMDDYGKWRMFLLYDGKKRKETAFNMEPGVGEPSVHRLRKEPKEETPLIFSILEGTGSVQLCFSPAKEAPYGTAWQTIQAGTPLKTTYGEMGSKGRYLLVKLKEGKVGMVRVRMGRNN